MAEAIAAAAGGYDKTLMSFHPQPKEGGGSSTWFHNEPWLDFNMHQTGHCANQPTYELIKNDYNLLPIKPTMDGEPLYEDHPNCFNARELGHSSARDIRRIMYWNVFAGAFELSHTLPVFAAILPMVVAIALQRHFLATMIAAFSVSTCCDSRSCRQNDGCG